LQKFVLRSIQDSPMRLRLRLLAANILEREETELELLRRHLMPSMPLAPHTTTPSDYFCQDYQRASQSKCLPYPLVHKEHSLLRSSRYVTRVAYRCLSCVLDGFHPCPVIYLRAFDHDRHKACMQSDIVSKCCWCRNQC
jgi:hypothetical protein